MWAPEVIAAQKVPPTGTKSSLQTAPAIPIRSTLFSLPPIATNSPFVEGLSRYLNRLAVEHSVSTADLIELDLFPVGVPASADRRQRRRLFHTCCYLMDGSLCHTEPWIQAIEVATTQGGLPALTLLPYLEICDGSWLRPKRAWCPECFEAWARAHCTIYEPLLWSIKVSYRCPVHQVSLESNCRHCGRSSAPLAGRSQPGFCAWCLGWLGSNERIGQQAPNRYELWCSHEAAALVAATGTLQSLLPRDAMARALRRLLEGMPEINRVSLADYVGCTRRSISTWIEGTTRPRVQSLFRLSYALSTTTLSLLSQECDANPNGPEAIGQTVSGILGRIPDTKVRTGRPRRAQRTLISGPSGRDPLSIEQLRHALELSLQSENPVSPRRIAKQLGYSSPDRVLRMFSNLCASLNARLTRQAKARKIQIRDRLQDALRESPPPTLKSIARELRMSSSTRLRSIDDELCARILERGEQWKHKELKHIRILLQGEIEGKAMVSLSEFCNRHRIPPSLVLSQLPDLKKSYEQLYGRFKAAQRSQRRVEFRQRVKEAVVALIERGDYPSAGNVLKRNPSLARSGWDEIQSAISAAIESTKERQ